jgi:hypothetical protein
MAVSAPLAFVIMPFAEDFLAGFEDVIAPGIELAGFRCLRADQEPQGHIQSQMFERIFDATAVVADISGRNSNVFYELGVAHSLGRRTITVAREDYMDRVPFDVAPYRVLVYPQPPGGTASHDEVAEYRARAAEASQHLADELRGLARPGSPGITNPVQDYLAQRSPLTSTESLYLSKFGSDVEEEMLRGIDAELVHVSVTGSSFVSVLGGYVESGERTQPLRVRLALLDPADQEAWRYVYHLREGRAVSPEELETYLAEDRASQERTQRILERLTRLPLFDGSVSYYRGVPLLWAYAIDRSRLVVGHLAQERLGSRNMPVSVLVKDDPKTDTLFSYYLAVIDSLIGT